MLWVTLIFHDGGVVRRRSGINEEFDCSTKKEIEAALRYGFCSKKIGRSKKNERLQRVGKGRKPINVRSTEADQEYLPQIIAFR
jgi:hypothetical protein